MILRLRAATFVYFLFTAWNFLGAFSTAQCLRAEEIICLWESLAQKNSGFEEKDAWGKKQVLFDSFKKACVASIDDLGMSDFVEVSKRGKEDYFRDVVNFSGSFFGQEISDDAKKNLVKATVLLAQSSKSPVELLISGVNDCGVEFINKVFLNFGTSWNYFGAPISKKEYDRGIFVKAVDPYRCTWKKDGSSVVIIGFHPTKNFKEAKDFEGIDNNMFVYCVNRAMGANATIAFPGGWVDGQPEGNFFIETGLKEFCEEVVNEDMETIKLLQLQKPVFFHSVAKTHYLALVLKDEARLSLKQPKENEEVKFVFKVPMSLCRAVAERFPAQGQGDGFFVPSWKCIINDAVHCLTLTFNDEVITINLKDPKCWFAQNCEQAVARFDEQSRLWQWCLGEGKGFSLTPPPSYSSNGLSETPPVFRRGRDSSPVRGVFSPPSSGTGSRYTSRSRSPERTPTEEDLPFKFEA